MTNEEESLLVKQAQRDPEAFGRLFDIYYGRIFNYCLRRVSHNTTAEDLTSEIFFKALNNLAKYRFKGAPFGAWLFKIAHNAVLDYYRKAPAQTSSLDNMVENHGFDFALGGNASAEMMEKEANDERYAAFKNLATALPKLPEHYRETITLRYFEKLSIAEIGEILGKPEGTVKSLLSRGADLLRDALTQPVVPSPVVSNESRN